MLTTLWTRLAPYGVLVSAVLIVAQTWPALDARWLWYSDEVRYVEAFFNMLFDGQWLVLELNGEVYSDKPPVYFWMLVPIYWLTGWELPAVMFAGSGLSAILLIAAMDYLGRTIGMAAEARTAGALTFIGGLGAIILLHYIRMDLLFVALMLAGHATLHAHVFHKRGTWVLVLGFTAMAAGILTKGPLAIALPLAAIVVTALWAGRWRGLFTRGMAIGFAVMIGWLALWALGVVLVEGWRFFVDTMVGRQVVARATDAFHHSEPFHYYFIMLPLVILPWTGMVFALPVGGGRPSLSALRARMKAAYPGDILALSAMSNFLFLSALDGKSAVYLLPVVCYLHLLIGIALIERRARIARWATAVIAVALAIALAVTVSPYAWEAGRIWAVIAGAVLLAALAFVLVSRRLERGPRALGLGVVSTGLGLVAAVGLFPILNNYMSPKPLADALMTEAAEGATPMTYKTFGGVFTYYAGQDLPNHDTPDALRTALAEPGQGAVLMPVRHADEIDEIPMSEVYRGSMIGGRGEYVVLVEPAE